MIPVLPWFMCSSSVIFILECIISYKTFQTFSMYIHKWPVFHHAIRAKCIVSVWLRLKKSANGVKVLDVFLRGLFVQRHQTYWTFSCYIIAWFQKPNEFLCCLCWSLIICLFVAVLTVDSGWILQRRQEQEGSQKLGFGTTASALDRTENVQKERKVREGRKIKRRHV